MVDAPIASTPQQAVKVAAVHQAFRAWWTSQRMTGNVEERLNNLTPVSWKGFCRSPEAKALGVTLPVWDGSAATPQATPATPSPQPLPSTPIIPQQPATGNGHAPDLTAAFQAFAQGLQAVGFKASEAVTADTVKTIAYEAAAEVLGVWLQDMIDQGKLQMTQKVQVTVGAQEHAPVEGSVPAWFDRLVKLTSVRQNALLIGPAGSGKTTAAEMLAKSLGLPFTRVSMSAGVDEGQLLGWLLPIGDSGKFEYVPSPVVTAYENGGVVLFDELDAADSNLLLALNAALDNGHWDIPMRTGVGLPALVRHKDFIVVAAANTYGHGATRVYVGRNQLDGATLRRFRLGQINTDYDPVLEGALFDPRIVAYGHLLRARCRAQQGWTRDVSTGEMADAHKLLAIFGTPEEAWYGFFADWSEQELERVHVRINHTADTATLR
jgi:hypothetical protein